MYLQPVDLGRLTVDGIGGLRKLDPAVRVERQKDAVQVGLGRLTLRRLDAPYGPMDANGWSRVLFQAINQLRGASLSVSAATPDRIYQAVFNGMLADLDGYSRYAGPTRAALDRAQREGFGGIGVHVERLGDQVIVTGLSPRGPALRAGVRIGDSIVAINGDTTRPMKAADIDDRLRGPAGSTVVLTLAPRDDSPKAGEITVVITRALVIPDTVTLTLSGRVAVIKIDRFNAATTADLRAALDQARRDLGIGARGYILDLRGNPGGLLDQAVGVATLFMPRGVILSTIGRAPESRQQFDAMSGDYTDGLPLVVLVDGRSASAAEVVTAALQDSGRAVVVGANSYGKGSVQTVTRLPNDGELFLTWSRIYTPGGYTLNRQGVVPNICTSGTVDKASTLVAELKAGRLSLPSMLRTWRAEAGENNAALLSLRAMCPWHVHPADLDMKVALMLLSDPRLYRRALHVEPRYHRRPLRIAHHLAATTTP